MIFLDISHNEVEQYHLETLDIMSTMKAVGVSAYGHIDNFESRDVPRPARPTGRDVLVK
jgi:hypothetical protein